MNAVWMRVRAEMRGRWRAWFGLAVLLGLPGGAVIAAAAGARRTETAYPRFLEAQRAHDVGVGFQPDPSLDLGRVEALPQVVATARLSSFDTVEGAGAFGGIAAHDDRFGRSLARWKVLAGRLPRADRIDEAVVGFREAENLDIGVGDVVRRRFHAPHSTEGRGRLVPVTFTVVGIMAGPLDFTVSERSGSGALFLTPAFYRRYADELRRTLDVTLVRLRRGPRDADAFLAGLRRLPEGESALTVRVEDDVRKVQRSFDLQATALWVLAGFVGLATLLVFGQASARQAFLEASEYPVLGALGMTRAQLSAVGMTRSALVGLAGCVLAVGVALLLSPLTPLGRVRVAEPHPGFAVDATALPIGAAAVIGLAGLVSVLPVVRAAHRRGSPLGTAEPVGPGRPSGVAGALARAAAPPTVVAGARLALEPGRGSTAVPLRTSVLGVTFGIAALAMALTFDASLTNLLGTPRLYGLRWDSILELSRPSDQERVATALRSDAAIQAFALGRGEGGGISNLIAEIDGNPGVSAIALDEDKGSVLPPVTRGRAPQSAAEIVLAPRTLEAVGKRIGDTVDVRIFGEGPRAMRVVGHGLIPPLGEDGRFGEGALIRASALTELFPSVPAVAFIAVRFAPEADGAAVLAGLRRRFGEALARIDGPETPVDLVSFGRVQKLPVILAGLLAALAASILAHVLLSSIRRRRRDLAILKTLGFVRAQVRRTVAWQATIFAMVAMMLGLPVGVAAGRWLWNLFANQRGLVPEPRVSFASILLTVVATLGFANLIAAVPGRAAARIRPAVMLRAE